MEDNLSRIPGRIKEFREILEISAMDMARDIGAPLEVYEKYESGDLDIPISVLYKISNRLGTDTTVLLTGEDPRMETASVCRAGKGIQVERYPGYGIPAWPTILRAEPWNPSWFSWIRKKNPPLWYAIPARSSTTW
jgi:transcriptional regulator with XRE-family HTH domain